MATERVEPGLLYLCAALCPNTDKLLYSTVFTQGRNAAGICRKEKRKRYRMGRKGGRKEMMEGRKEKKGGREEWRKTNRIDVYLYFRAHSRYYSPGI
jgi:hypothetical protein